MEKSSQKLETYLDEIAAIGRRVPPDLWWLSWISGKNRYLSSFSGEVPKFQYRNMARKIYRLCTEIVYARFRLGRPKPTGDFYVIKTFSFGLSFDGEKFRDPFFPMIRDHMEKHGMRVLTVYDPIGHFKKGVDACARYENVLPFHAFLSVTDVFAMLWKQFKISRLPVPADVPRDIAKKLKSECLMPDSLQALCISRAFENLQKTAKITHLLMTGEGNPWERTLIQNLRRMSPATKIIAYQHTVVPEAATNVYPGAGETEYAPMPDYFLTVGEETAAMLKEHGHYGSERPKIVPACAIRFDYLSHTPVRTRPLGKRLLVAVEGVPEASALVLYALKQAPKLDGWSIIVRTHPAYRMASFMPECAKGIAANPAIELSESGSVSADLERSDVVLYWGTTVALEAIKTGLPVVHLDLGYELSHDPLYRCENLHYTVKHDQELKPVLDEILSMPAEKLERERKLARTYLDRYFAPVSEERLDMFAAIFTKKI